jgi:hypothetical protein
MDSRVMTIYRVFLIAVFLTACLADKRLILEGSYQNPLSDEYVTVQKSKIRFHINLRNEKGEKLLDQEYQYYSVWTNGRILPRPLRSVDAVYGVGRYDWYWNGEAILRKDPKTGETAQFLREQK